MRRLGLVTTAILTLTLAACEKRSASGDTTPPTEPAPTASSAAAASSQPIVTPSGVASGADSALAADAGTSAPAAASGRVTPRDGASAGAGKGTSKHISGNNFTLDIVSTGCKASSVCVMTMKLGAVGDYHVNKEYPYKFTASAAPNVEFLGKGEATTFTRAAGDFVEQGEKEATMTVRFKPASPGDVHIAGTYRFSVCSADQCQIEQEKVELTVPVM